MFPARLLKSHRRLNLCFSAFQCLPVFWRRPCSCRSLKTLSWKARPCLTLSAHHTPVGAHLLAAPSGSFRPRLPTATLVSLSTPSFHCRARCCLTHRLAPAPQSASWSSAQERLPTLSSTVSLQASDHDLHLRKITHGCSEFPSTLNSQPFSVSLCSIYKPRRKAQHGVCGLCVINSRNLSLFCK